MQRNERDHYSYAMCCELGFRCHTIEPYYNGFAFEYGTQTCNKNLTHYQVCHGRDHSLCQLLHSHKCSINYPFGSRCDWPMPVNGSLVSLHSECERFTTAVIPVCTCMYLTSHSSCQNIINSLYRIWVQQSRPRSASWVTEWWYFSCKEIAGTWRLVKYM